MQQQMINKLGVSNRVDSEWTECLKTPAALLCLIHTLTHHHHISVTVVLRMVHHPNNTYRDHHEEQGAVYREDGLQSVIVELQGAPMW